MKRLLESSIPGLFFGGDCSFGPKNIITAVADGHKAATSIHRYLEARQGRSFTPEVNMKLESLKMGLHEWSYSNEFSPESRYKVPELPLEDRFSNKELEVELGFDLEIAVKEARRCLNCDVQTVFDAPACIECDSCLDICPTDCLTIAADGTDEDLSGRLKAPRLNPTQQLFKSEALSTKRIMIKDEDVCLHCGLCSERCPTGAWDMQKYTLKNPLC